MTVEQKFLNYIFAVKIVCVFIQSFDLVLLHSIERQGKH